MDPPSPSSSRPSFSSFWKRSKDAASSAVKQVTFVPTIPTISGSRIRKRKGGKGDNNGAAGAVVDEDSKSKDGGSGGDEEDPEQASASTTGQKTAKEKAQIRRAQVRRAQIQHRKRKADYMQQLELDVDTLRDLITTAEKEMQAILKENDSIRIQLGIATVRPARSLAERGKGTSKPAPAGVDATMELDGTAAAVNDSVTQADALAADIPRLSLSPAPPIKLTVSPLPGATATPTTAEASPTPNDMTSLDGSPMSLFNDIDLDDINVTVVMDEAVGNPVYQISTGGGSSTPLTPAFTDQLTPQTAQGFPVSPITPYSIETPEFDPSFSTDVALASDFASRNPMRAAPAYFLPNLSVAQTHQVVNFILALEHVCWGHAGHQFHLPGGEYCADGGHAMMASALLLRDAPEDVFTTIESTTINPQAKNACAYTTNMDPENAESTCQQVQTHKNAFGLSWMAPNVTLQALYGLAVSLNPISDTELTPVQGWFELAARYPLSILLRPDVMDGLKRGLVGVVRCLYFGAVMEREAFESVVQRVVEPVMEAEAAAAAAAIGAAEIPLLMPASSPAVPGLAATQVKPSDTTGLTANFDLTSLAAPSTAVDERTSQAPNSMSL